MPWFRIDDQMAFHAKVVAAGNAAIGLWARAGSWSASALTDGFIPKHMIAPLGTIAQAKRLVKVGLWSEVEGGFQFHQWAERQPFSKADTERKRAAARARMARARAAKAERSSSDVRANIDGFEEGSDLKNSSHVEKTSEEFADNSHRFATSGEPHFAEEHQVGGGSSREHNANTTRSSFNPNPTQPNPTEVPYGTSKGGSRKRAPARDRGHRLPDNWKPSDDAIRQMREECPHLDLRAEHAKFVDYWNDQPGAKGRKVDWTGTWRNWMRRAGETRRPTPRQQVSSRESEFVSAEMLKDNPNPEVLRRAGIEPPTAHLRALPGGL
ncbi:hypothetical protein IU421_14915 [Nocardia cyriacigeorgica]|uniref:hypothetical protein n=1 Tax=Nocardia cyriacigeorgica TaxID=135487 RepID=UPI001895B617|nr:hypothetical protein [Nocardia cyriacigeorgica]MBF6515562.1 hypothetical protein [Nocardia cyriacigeorgica]